MKFLGLMGVLLWLGTLLGAPGGAEPARFCCALLEKEISSVDVPSGPGAAKCESEKKHVFAGDFLGGDEAVILASPAVVTLVGHFYPAGERAGRAPWFAWHFGQGPPRADPC